MPHHWKGAIWATAAALSAAGCTSLPAAQKDALVQASQLYERGDLAGATSRLDRIIGEYPKAIEIAEAHYLRGLCRSRAGQLPAAGGDFETAIARSQREDLTRSAQASLASVAYRQADWARAADYYDQALKTMPDEPPTDEIALAAGMAMQRAGRWRDAALQFGRVLRAFKNRPVAAAAARLAAWPNEYFTIQLAVYSTADAGAQAVQPFKTRGLDASVQSMHREGRILWVVTTGRYPTYNEALAALNRIRQTEPQAVILP